MNCASPDYSGAQLLANRVKFEAEKGIIVLDNCDRNRLTLDRCVREIKANKDCGWGVNSKVYFVFSDLACHCVCSPSLPTLVDSSEDHYFTYTLYDYGLDNEAFTENYLDGGKVETSGFENPTLNTNWNRQGDQWVSKKNNMILSKEAQFFKISGFKTGKIHAIINGIQVFPDISGPPHCMVRFYIADDFDASEHKMNYTKSTAAIADFDDDNDPYEYKSLEINTEDCCVLLYAEEDFQGDTYERICESGNFDFSAMKSFALSIHHIEEPIDGHWKLNVIEHKAYSTFVTAGKHLACNSEIVYEEIGDCEAIALQDEYNYFTSYTDSNDCEFFTDCEHTEYSKNAVTMARVSEERYVRNPAASIRFASAESTISDEEEIVDLLMSLEAKLESAAHSR